MSSSTDMIAKNVFEREVQYIEGRIRFLDQQPYDDETDTRLAQEEVWTLEETRTYLSIRIKELS